MVPLGVGTTESFPRGRPRHPAIRHRERDRRVSVALWGEGTQRGAQAEGPRQDISVTLRKLAVERCWATPTSKGCPPQLREGDITIFGAF